MNMPTGEVTLTSALVELIYVVTGEHSGIKDITIVDSLVTAMFFLSMLDKELLHSSLHACYCLSRKL